MLSHPDDAFDPADDPSAERGPRPFRAFRLVAKLTACAALIAALSLVARDRSGAPETARTWSEPPRTTEGARRAVAATEPLLTLREEAGALPPQSEPTRWTAASGQREDGVSQGSFDTIEAPYLLAIATDSGGRAEAAPSLFVTLVRRAADGRGLSVTRTGGRGVVATRLGSFETVEATLTGAGKRTCTGFRSLDLRAVSIDGWLCAILGQAPESRAVACAVDRIALAGRVAASFGADMAARATDCGQEDIAGAGPGDRTGSIAVTEAGAPATPGHNAAKARRK